MLKRVRTALSLSTSVMVFSAYMALATTVEYGKAVLLLPVIVFMLVPLAEWLDYRFPSYRKVTTLITLCYTLAIPLVLFQYALFPTVVALVVYIQAYKLLHIKEDRDYQHIFLMSFFLLVTACVLSPDASIALPILTFLISSVWSFFTLQVHSEAVKEPKTMAPDIVPLHVQRPSAPTVDSRRFMDLGVFVSSTAISLACILMTAVFFVATPRMEAGVLGGSSMRTAPQSTASVTGLAESVELVNQSVIRPDVSPVMRVQTPDEPNGHYDGPLYWRSTSLDRYNGTGWESQSEPTWIENDAMPQVRYVATSNTLDRTPLRNSHVVKQSIFLNRVPENGIPALTLAQRVETTARLRWNKRKGDGTVELAEQSNGSLLYDAYSEVDEPTPEMLRSARSDYHSIFVVPAHYDRLTYQDLSPDLLDLVKQIAAPYDNLYDKVLAIQRYLSTDGGFSYSLDTPIGNVAHPVEQFLRVARIGHCELFASAMALMVRTLGVPARVVTGYRGGEWDEQDRAFIVRADMAHLWVEAYFVDYGWVTFDPSPPHTGVPDSVQSKLEYAFYTAVLKAKMAWYQHVVGFDNHTGLGGFHGITTRLFGWLSGDETAVLGTGGAASSGKGMIRKVLYSSPAKGLMMLGLFFLMIVAVANALKKRSRMNSALRRVILTRDQLRAVRLFKLVRRRLRDLGAAEEGKTAEEIMGGLARMGAPNASLASQLLEAYNQVRFGGVPLSRGQFSQLSKAVRTL